MKKNYSKPLGKVFGLKKYFIEKNDSLVEAEKKNVEFYKSQQERKNCKICRNKLEQPYFQRKGINYYLCSTCSHLNGQFEDSEQFNNFIYVEENTSDDRREHQTVDMDTYLSKVDNIYFPKTDFFLKNIDESDFTKKKFLDIGAGIGHLTYSYIKKHNLNNVKGVDVSSDQVSFGNKVMGKEVLSSVSPNDLIPYIEKSDANYVSMIVVLEHLTDPMAVMNSLKNNSNVEYLLIAVPMLSFSVMTQLSFKDVFERVLYGGHTHLYTYDSLKYLIENNGFEIVTEWWFGSDVFDLFRSMLVDMGRNPENKSLMQDFEKKYFAVIDEMQNIIDKAEMSSEIHMVLKKSK